MGILSSKKAIERVGDVLIVFMGTIGFIAFAPPILPRYNPWLFLGLLGIVAIISLGPGITTDIIQQPGNSDLWKTWWKENRKNNWKEYKELLWVLGILAIPVALLLGILTLLISFFFNLIGLPIIGQIVRWLYAAGSFLVVVAGVYHLFGKD